MKLAYLVPYGSDHSELQFVRILLECLEAWVDFTGKQNDVRFENIALICNGLLRSCLRKQAGTNITQCPYCHRSQMALVSSFGHPKYNLGNFITSTPRFYEQLLLAESEIKQKVEEICGEDITFFYLYLSIRNALRTLEISSLIVPRSSKPFFEISLLVCAELALPLLVVDHVQPPYISLEIVNSDWSSLRIFSVTEDIEEALLRELMHDKRHIIVEQVVNLAEVKCSGD